MNKTHASASLFETADNLKNISLKQIELASLNPVSRFKTLHPYLFYSTITGIIAVGAFKIS